MLQPNQVIKLTRLIENYAKAKVDASWAGSADVDDQNGIYEHAENARTHLFSFIATLQGGHK